MESSCMGRLFRTWLLLVALDKMLGHTRMALLSFIVYPSMGNHTISITMLSSQTTLLNILFRLFLTGRFTDYHFHQKIQQSFLAECYLLQETWFADPTWLDTVSHNLTLDSWASEEHYFNDISDPWLLAARSASLKYNEDDPSFDTATRGPFQAQFWKAMYNELTTLIQVFDCWDCVPRTPNMNVLPSTKYLGVQNQALPWRSCEDIQGMILCKRRQTERRGWLFWNLGSCCPMVDSAHCYDFGHKTEPDLCPMQHHSCFHPWTGHWNHICPST